MNRTDPFEKRKKTIELTKKPHKIAEAYEESEEKKNSNQAHIGGLPYSDERRDLQNWRSGGEIEVEPASPIRHVARIAARVEINAPDPESVNKRYLGTRNENPYTHPAFGNSIAETGIYER